MSIKIEQLNAMLGQQELHKTNSKTSTSLDFKSTLAEELGLSLSDTSQKTQQSSLNSKVNTLDLLLSTQSDVYSEEQANHDNALQNTISQTSTALNTWDAYVNELGKSDGRTDLREAYSHLQGLDGQINALKQNAQGILNKSPSLAGIIEELDVMRVTETYKFNRGDYA